MTLHRTVRLAQSLVLLVLPHGGQHTARRNAWAGTSSAASRSRDGRAAEAALRTAAARADRRAATGA